MLSTSHHIRHNNCSLLLMLLCKAQQVSSKAYPVLQKIWKYDYAGIVILIVASFVPVIYYTFLCSPGTQAFYLSTTLLLGGIPRLPFSSKHKPWVSLYHWYHVIFVVQCVINKKSGSSSQAISVSNHSRWLTSPAVSSCHWLHYSHVCAEYISDSTSQQGTFLWGTQEL